MQQAVSMPAPAPERGRAAALRCIKTADKVVQTCVDVTFILLLLIGVYFLADTIHVYYHAGLRGSLPQRPVNGDLSALQQELSEDVIGWITLDNTTIDYPVMQGVDNYEYLNRDPYGNYALAGSIYLDSRNRADFTDEYSLLYGHHMSGGYMFGALDDFEDPAYFRDHRTGTLITSRGVLPIRVLAFAYTDASNEVIFDPTQQEVYLPNWIRENAINYNKDAEEGPLVALSTCKSPTSTRRMVVFVTIGESG